MSCALWLAAVSFDDWRWDEKLAVTVFVLALAFLGWAFSFTAAEGALRPQRMAFRASGLLLVAAGIYAVARIWW